MPTGGASCSVILTCLEVLQACEKQNSENGIAYSLHFALLYQYARQKVVRSFRACLHGVGDPGLVGLVSFVSTLWGTQNKRNLPH